MTRRLALALVAASSLMLDATSPLVAQEPAPAAKSVIRGRITAADTGRPLRRAQVTVTASELGAPRHANTGLDGRYEFSGLPPGRYTVSVTRNGYLPLRYGQRRAMEAARPLQLSDGQSIDSVDVALPRTGVITGHVLDDAGEPIAGVRVEALRPAWVEGRRQLVIVAATSGPQGTDDTGQYRLSNLPPGRYYLRALTRETWTVATAARRELMGFAATYYPSTPNAADSRLVEVGVASRVTADILLVPGRPASVSGFAYDSRGRPLVGRAVALSQRFLREFPGGGGTNVASAVVAADGSFTFRDVTPAEYQVSVTMGDFGRGEGETARVTIMVDGVDVDNVRLTTSAGWSVSGRIVTEDGLPPSFARNAMRVGATTLNQLSVVAVGAAEINDDWTFTVRTIVGPARLWATPPDGWMVKGLRQDGRDITSTLLELKSGERLADVELVVSNRLSVLAGQITDDRGAPVSTGTVIIFADDDDRWGESSAFVRTARPDQTGSYEIIGLPAGDYLAVALDYVQDGIWNDPEYLDSLRRYAERVTIVDGASQPLTLRLTQP